MKANLPFLPNQVLSNTQIIEIGGVSILAKEMLEYCRGIGGNLVISQGLLGYLSKRMMELQAPNPTLHHSDFPEYFFIAKTWRTFDVVTGGSKPQHSFDGSAVTLFFAIRKGF